MVTTPVGNPKWRKPESARCIHLGATKRRVLFINPAKRDHFGISRVHMGFTLMASTLVSDGHEVRVIDYAFLQERSHRIRIPSVESAIAEFRPDMIGISVFSYLRDECRAMVARIGRVSHVPIILGGPHFSVFPEDFAAANGVSYIVRGEADTAIAQIVRDAALQDSPVFIDCPPTAADSIPPVNLDVVYGNQLIDVYQIQLSRGCPYSCSFCSIEKVAGRAVRSRQLETCIEQIVAAKRDYPGIRGIVVTDDCPTFDIRRFRQFLSIMTESGIGCSLFIDNVRANLIDTELLRLYVAAGGKNICLGVESGDPEVFLRIKKGESLRDIMHAARLVRDHGLILGLCFVIGLPGDTLERHIKSVQLAKSLQPDYAYWQMCIPWPGTEVRSWYDQHGEVRDVRNFSSFIDPRANFQVPVCSTPDFPIRDRIRAWLMASMESSRYFRDPRALPRLFGHSIRYNLMRSFFIYLTKTFWPEMVRQSLAYWGRMWQKVSPLDRQTDGDSDWTRSRA